jgi:signal transduction histidine kinase/DNA-binding response OmpR family regulator
MGQGLTKRILDRIDRHLFDPRLDAEALLRKRWAWMWLVVTLFGVILTGIYFMFILGLYELWWSAVVFHITYLVGFPVYKKSLRFDLVLNIIFTIFILTIFVVMIQAGGINSSLGLVFVGLTGVLGSVLAGNRKWTISLFALYLGTIILLGILQPYLTVPEHISPGIQTQTFVFSTIWMTTTILWLLLLFQRDQRRLQKAEADRLRKLDEAKTKLYTNVSHEFRTPLTVIRGMAEQLEKNPEKWMDKAPGKIITQSDVLLRLVNQMLDIARIEAENMVLEPVHGDLGHFLRQVTGSFQGLAEGRKIDLEVLAPEEPVLTDYDPGKLMQVLANLLSNALKFTQAGGSVTVNLEKATGNPDNSAVIRVSDTGRGIPEESVDRVFDRFYQVPDQQEETPGTGLGLALTRELVRMMGGRITVESTLGQGTAFTVTLPISDLAPKEKGNGISMAIPGKAKILLSAEGELKTGIEAGVDGEQPLLLIVEDNADVREYLLAILDTSYRCVTAPNGKAGLEKAMELIPDLILTDVMMPVMDGFELLKRLREDHRTDHIPVVVLTARGDMGSQLAGLEIGADHYLVKPFSEQELVLKLRNLLDARDRMRKLLGQPYSGTINEEYSQEGQFLASLRAKLDEQLDNEDLSIQDLCMALNMSRSQLYRKFTAITNQPIGRYIRSYRLMRAKEMMESAGRNVSEAAMDTGFRNLSHFSAAFREEFGFSPSELVRGQG